MGTSWEERGKEEEMEEREEIYNETRREEVEGTEKK